MERTGAKVSDMQARLGHSNLATTGRSLAALRVAENPQRAVLEALFGVQQEQEPAHRIGRAHVLQHEVTTQHCKVCGARAG